MSDTSKTAKIIKGDIIQQHIDSYRRCYCTYLHEISYTN